MEFMQINEALTHIANNLEEQNRILRSINDTLDEIAVSQDKINRNTSDIQTVLSNSLDNVKCSPLLKELKHLKNAIEDMRS